MTLHLDCKRLLLGLLFAVGVLTTNGVAVASGDYGCTARWKLYRSDFDACSNTVILSPGNDTRANLLLLMAEFHPLHPVARKNTPADANALPTDGDTPIFSWEKLAETLGNVAGDEVAAPNEQQLTTDNCPMAPDTLTDQFSQAIRKDISLSNEERKALLMARGYTQTFCSPEKTDPALAKVQEEIKSDSARDFLVYLKGARSFQVRAYDDAARTFQTLRHARNVWVRDTATYMIGRTLLNQAQVGAFDEYGASNANWHADTGLIVATEAALDDYLHQYPDGLYAQSARGLKRRCYWLGGDVANLEAEYSALMRMPVEKRDIDDVSLAEEIDNKLLTIEYGAGFNRDLYSIQNLMLKTHDPILLAVFDLLSMRVEQQDEHGGVSSASMNSSGPGSRSGISLVQLQEQRPFFKDQMPLYDYLLAVYQLYVEKKPAEVLRIIPDRARQVSFSSVQFSRQALRGMALEAMHDRNALGFWSDMLPGSKAPFQRETLELAIAYHQERTGDIKAVFASDSPVHFPYLREVLLTYIADADLLRRQAAEQNVSRRERDVAAFTLLYKDLTRGKAVDFLRDMSLIPENAATKGSFSLTDMRYEAPEIPIGIFRETASLNGGLGCGSLKDTETLLAKSADNPTAQLCAADFMLLHSSYFYIMDQSPSADELGGTKSLLSGGRYVRMNTYRSVLQNARSGEKDKAYALYRAVRCYAPSGNNDCGGDDVPVAQRKAWFQMLKRDYANTTWAKGLKYYW